MILLALSSVVKSHILFPSTTSIRDAYSISREARTLSSQNETQSTQLSTNSSVYSRPALPKTLQSNVPVAKSTATESKKYVSPRQKDYEAFMAGQSYQEELNESLVERLQEESLEINVNGKATSAHRY